MQLACENSKEVKDAMKNAVGNTIDAVKEHRKQNFLISFDFQMFFHTIIFFSDHIVIDF